MPDATEPTPAAASTDWRLAVESFVSFYTGHTRAAYELDLSLFERWCADQGIEPLAVTRLQLEAFARHLVDKRGNCHKTMQRRMHAVRRFFNLAAADGIIAASPAAAVRLPSRYSSDHEPDLPYLDRYQLQDLLTTARRAGPAPAALVALLGLMGLRVSEATALAVGDYQHVQDGHRVLRFTGKGGKPAVLPVTVPVLRLLDLAAGDRPAHAPLLVRRDGTPYPYRAALRLITRLGRDTGLQQHITPHALRRSFVSACLDAGASIRDTQTASRHADPRMVMRYDRARYSLDRSAIYTVSAFVAGAA